MKEARPLEGWTQNCMVMFSLHSVSQSQVTDLAQVQGVGEKSTLDGKSCESYIEKGCK